MPPNILCSTLATPILEESTDLDEEENVDNGDVMDNRKLNDLSNNINLEIFSCWGNQLSCLNAKNGNNINFIQFICPFYYSVKRICTFHIS